MKQFLNDLLLANSAIYTLWGSKPITEIILYHYTDEEMQAYYDSLSEEERKQCFAIEGYNLSETWEKWEKISKQFSMQRYMLFKSDLIQHPKATFVYFVDILKAAIVLQENYEIFREIIGFDFTPLEVILEMKEKNSKFWIAMRDNNSSVLWGLLFGFGKINSYAYHWKHFDHPETCAEFCKKMPTYLNTGPFHGKVNFSIEKFEIPPFISFEETDEVVERYKAERERIQKIYKGKDFVDLTLQRLTK